MYASPAFKTRRRLRATEWTLLALLVFALIGVDLMFWFWPFRYRQVHPLLESTFDSSVHVGHYHRTYFPHPGFVADEVAFQRRGASNIPPLATIRRMTVVGTWTGLIFHPHTLFRMRLEGLHVQIPPSGTGPGGMDIYASFLHSSEPRLRVQTVAADGAILDLLRSGQPPWHFQFEALQVHNLHIGEPLTWFARLTIPGPGGLVETNGSLGPFRLGQYPETPVSGTYSLHRADLHRVSGLFGQVAADGRFRGVLSRIEVQGSSSIPDFRAGDAHTVRMDAAYHVTILGSQGSVQIDDAQVRTGDNTIRATGSVAGTPRTVSVTISTRDSHVEQLLDLVEQSTPSVAGLVTFQANAQFQEGSDPFLKRLRLQGQLSLDRLRFVQPDTRDQMNAFSARVRRDDPDEQHTVTAQASSHTDFREGMASFPDVYIAMPGARAHLHGTFNLLNTGIHFTGKAALERSISHAETGWKSVLLKPLAPFFRHRKAGAVVPIAVTGTAEQPKIGQDLLHDK